VKRELPPDHRGLIFVRRATGALRSELRILIEHLRGVRAARKHRGCRGLKVHVGCGPKLKPGWINIDLAERADITLDLRKPMPFDDGSCEIIYSEHFFEHLDYPDDAALHLRDCARLLRAGGTLSLGVPDAEGPLRWYAGVRQRAEYGEAPQALQPWDGHPEWVQTPMEQINFLFRQNYRCDVHEHRYAYDFATLEALIRQAGFCEVRRRPFDPGLDSEDRRVGTLYVSATRA